MASDATSRRTTAWASVGVQGACVGPQGGPGRCARCACGVLLKRDAGCMRAGCLKDLQRFLRNDDPDLRTVFFKLCRFETAKTDLVPLLKACAGEKDIVFNTRASGYMRCRVAHGLQPQPQPAPASCVNSASAVRSTCPLSCRCNGHCVQDPHALTVMLPRPLLATCPRESPVKVLTFLTMPVDKTTRFPDQQLHHQRAIKTLFTRADPVEVSEGVSLCAHWPGGHLQTQLRLLPWPNPVNPKRCMSPPPPAPSCCRLSLVCWWSPSQSTPA